MNIEDTRRPEETLTQRQQQIVRLMSLGYDNAEIAGECGISVQLTKNYIGGIYDKLGIDNRVLVARWYWMTYGFDDGPGRPAANVSNRPQKRSALDLTKRHRIVLDCLRKHFPDAAPRSVIYRSLGWHEQSMSRTIDQAILALRQAGYEIATVVTVGYRLIKEPVLNQPAAIPAA